MDFLVFGMRISTKIKALDFNYPTYASYVRRDALFRGTFSWKLNPYACDNYACVH